MFVVTATIISRSVCCSIINLVSEKKISAKFYNFGTGKTGFAMRNAL